MDSILQTIALQSVAVFLLLYLVNKNIFLKTENYLNVLILSAFLVGVTAIGSIFDLYGVALAWLVDIYIIMRALKYDLGGALLFSIGLGFLNMMAFSMFV
jgi:hypothetical protein